jgi:hypothetical protein
MDIHEGGVVFNTDPGDTNAIEWHYKTTEEGQYLRIIVQPDGFAHFLKGDPVWDSHDLVTLPLPDKNQILSLRSSGEVRVGAGMLDVKETTRLISDSRLVFAHVNDRTGISVEGEIVLNGALEVRSHELSSGSHTLITAGESLSGEFGSVDLPEGCSVAYENKSVILVVESTAAAMGPTPQGCGSQTAPKTKRLGGSGIILSAPSAQQPNVSRSWDLRGRRIDEKIGDHGAFRARSRSKDQRSNR